MKLSFSDRFKENVLYFGGGLVATQVSPYVFGTTLALKVAAPALGVFTLTRTILSHIQQNTPKINNSYFAKFSVDPLAFAVTMAVLPIFSLSGGGAVLLPLFALVLIGRALAGLVADGIHAAGLVS